MSDSPNLTQRLRDLDPAPHDLPIDRERQARLLEALLSPGPELGTDPAAHLPRRRPRRLAWVATAAAAAVAGLALPVVTGGQPAFATWTQEPRDAAQQDARALRRACLDQVGDTVGGNGAPRAASADLQTRLADRRGSWVSVLLTWTGPDRYQFSVACLGKLPPGSRDEPTDVTHSMSGGGGWAAPTGRELVEGPMAELSVGGGFLGLGRREQAATTNGDIGPDVVGVTIRAGSRRVEASVQAGTYAAWWPGRIPEAATPDASGRDRRPEPMLRYDLTLRDGTVLRDVDPVHPTN